MYILLLNILKFQWQFSLHLICTLRRDVKKSSTKIVKFVFLSICRENKEKLFNIFSPCQHFWEILPLLKSVVVHSLSLISVGEKMEMKANHIYIKTLPSVNMKGIF